MAWSIKDIEDLKAKGKIQGFNDPLAKISQQKDKRSKYGSKKKVDDEGNVFDSKKEYCRYQELKFLQSIGEISELRRQVVYQLSVCKYFADAVYKDKNGNEIVEDTKSKHTRLNRVYRLKKKMMLHELGITIKEF